MADYDNTHRAFLQVFLSRGTLTYETAKPILASILTASEPDRETQPNDITSELFSDYITSMNTAISPFDFEIRSTLPQAPYPSTTDSTTAPPNERVYALVNTTSDRITQLATSHSPDEIAFLKRLLDAMFETYNTRNAEILALTSLQALALSRGPATSSYTQSDAPGAPTASLTKAEAERCLESLVAEGWLDLSKKSYYRLSARALMELRTWLVETYNTGGGDGGSEDEDEDEERVERVRFCHGCREIVIVGQRCVDLDCGVRMHDFCARNVLRTAGGKRCPACKKGWSGEVLVGEKAAQRRASGVVNGRRSSGAVTNGVRNDEENE